MISNSKISSTSAALIEFHELGVAFGRNEVLRDISITVPRGQSLAIIGESGCGKTVLLKMIIGLLRPTSGYVAVDGKRIDRLDEKELTSLRSRCGFLFQNAALFDSMTVYDNIAFPVREDRTLSPDRRRALIIERLKQVGLPPSVLERRPAQLSGGMRKRVGLARALMMDPEVLLYDEPTTGLDPIMSDVINELILRTGSQSEMTSIVVTHDMTSVNKIAERVIMLYPLARLRDGEEQVIFDGTPKQMMESQDKRVAQFVRGQAGDRLMEMQEESVAGG